jgi:hypothetical protein
VSLLLAIAVTMLIVGASGNFVLADPCTATLNYPAIPVGYANSNVPIVVQISATCTTYYGSQLYATGNAYDATANTGLGSASTVLMSVNGGTEFNGQLGFNLPPSTQGHSLQISVSIYNGQYGNLITTTSETVEVGSEAQQQITTTTTVTEGQYPYAYPYPTTYPSPSQPSLSPSQHQFHRASQEHYQQEALAQTSINTNLFDYVVIIAILAAVIIATTGLVLVARRQPSWPQTQRR